MKKLLLIMMLFSISTSLWAQKSEDKPVLEYSDITINDNISLYAGKVNMEYFDQSQAYSVGFMLQDKWHSDIAFAFGYTQPASNFELFSQVYDTDFQLDKSDGVLFYLNYNF